MSSRISVIIPVLNEADTIARVLEHLNDYAFAKANFSEIIIVDGGSTDDTNVNVRSFANESKIKIAFISSVRGRAAQMNAGAVKATGDVLYFLHADSYPPKDYDRYILEEVHKGNLAGCFRMKFDSDHWWLRLAGWLTKFSWRASRGGDQSQFITRSLFEELEGFDERFIIYEDNDLINKLYERKQFVVIQKWLTTSARRYEENGVWKLQYHFWSIYVRKWFGASAEDLHNYYLKKIS